MVSKLIWSLRRRLVWIFMLLSSIFYPTLCNMDRDEAGSLPVFVKENHKEEKEAPISGFDFYSKEDYGQDWWDDNLRLSNEYELYYFPHVQEEKTKSAVNLKLGVDSNFTNSGDVGSNMIYDIADSIVKTGKFPADRRFLDTILQQARPGRVKLHKTMAENYSAILDEIHSQTRMKRQNTAVNLKLKGGSKFGNEGAIGSNFVKQYEDYSKEKYDSQAGPWKLGTAVNLNLGSTSTFENTGNIGSNLVSNRIFDSFHEPKYYDRDTSVIYSLLDPELLYPQNSVTYDNQGYIGSNVVENVRDTFSIPNVDRSFPRQPYFQRRRTKSAMGHIESNTIPKTKQQNRLNEKLNLKYSPYFQGQNTNAAVNFISKHGAKFHNEGEIGSNLIYGAARTPNANKIHSGTYFPWQQLRKMNSKANLNLGAVSTFDNRGKIGSNIEVIRKPALIISPNVLHYPGIPLSYPPSSQSENMNSAANLKASYGSKFDNEGEIGSNLLYNMARTASAIPTIHHEPYLPYLHTTTLNSGANLNLGQLSTFGNKGKIGSNIIRNRNLAQDHYYPEMPFNYPQRLRSENLNAATNLKTAREAKFTNEGEIGSNFVYTETSTKDRNNEQPVIYFPHKQWRTMNSAANLDLGPVSTFGNRGKIGSNVQMKTKPTLLSPQKVSYSPEIPLRYPERLRSENVNAAANLKTSYGTNFGNEGEIGSNLVYDVAKRTTSLPIIYSGPYLPFLHTRTLNSGANLNLGELSTFGNKGKIGSNIIRNRNLAQNGYYPEMQVNYPQSLRSENLNAATNVKTAQGAKFANEGEIGSNFVYTETSTKDRNNEQPVIYFPHKQWRTMHSAANLDLGPISMFGNRGKIGSNIEVKREPVIWRSQNIYDPNIPLRYSPRLRSENVNAATNLKTSYGTKFGNEGEIGSNFVYTETNTKDRNNEQPVIYFPHKQWRTMNSAANLDLGPVSTFGNRGKIGSNLQMKTEPTLLSPQKVSYSPEIPLRYPEKLRSEKVNAAANLKTSYGTKFGNEGEIGSNLVYNVAKRTTTSLPNIYSGPYLPYFHSKTLNSGANLNLGELSTFGNKGKIGSNIISNRNLAQNGYSPEMTFNYPQSLRSENLNAATNLKTAQGAKFTNEGEIGSNFVYTETSTKDRNNEQPVIYFPHKQWRTMNSAANLDLGPVATFGNRGKIGSNVQMKTEPTLLSPQKVSYSPEIPLRYRERLRSENVNAAANLKTSYGTKFGNEGEIGSNLLYNVAKRTTSSIPIIYSGPYLPYLHSRTLNSGANLNLGELSTFGNKGKIGSNIIRNRNLAQNGYSPEMTFNYPQRLRSENMNAATNLKAAQGAKFANEGEIGSNLVYTATITKDRDNEQPAIYFPHKQWRTMNSAANLDLGPVSAFDNRGKIASNIEVKREPAIWRSQNILYYPKISLGYPPRLRSGNANAAANLKSSYGTKFVNHGEISSNVFYNGLRRSTRSIPSIYSESYLPYLTTGTLNSGTNLNSGQLVDFGNKGKIGPSIIQNRLLGMLKVQSRHYPGEISKHSQGLQPENLNGTVLLNTVHGAKFEDAAEVVSNLSYNMEIRSANRNNKMHPGNHFSQHFNFDALPTFERKILRNSKPAIFKEGNNYALGAKFRQPPNFAPENMDSAANLQLNYGVNVGNVDSVGTDLERSRYHDIFSRQINPEAIKSSANLKFESGSYFSNKGNVGSSILNHGDDDFSKEKGYDERGTRQIFLNTPQKQSSCPTDDHLMCMPAYDNHLSETNSATKFYMNPKIIIRDSVTLSPRKYRDPALIQYIQNLKGFQSNVGYPNYVHQNGNTGIKETSDFEEMEAREFYQYYPDYENMGKIRVLRHRSSFSGLNSDRLKSAVNLQLGPDSSIENRGAVGTNTVRHLFEDPRSNFYTPEPGKYHRLQTAVNINLGSESSINNSGNIGSNSIFNIGHELLRTSWVPYFENDIFVDAYEYRHPATSANKYTSNRHYRTGPRNVQSAANLKLGTTAHVRNVGTIGSTLILNDDGVRRDTGAKPGQRFVSNSKNLPSSPRIYNKLQFGTPSSYDFGMWALRTTEKDANSKISKGKGIVNIFMEHGTLFENKGAFGNDRYEMYTAPSKIKLRGSKPIVTSYAYVIPPTGRGRSALSDGKVVTGISTKSFRQQPSVDNFNSENNYNRKSKHVFQERSSLINDGTIGAAEILFSRGSVFASNGSKTRMSKSPTPAVSFGKLGLDMAHSSNKASIIAGDNAKIVINGKMGTYQVSIPIGSIVASEGSDVSLRTYSPTDFFSESSGVGLRSSINSLKYSNSVITGIVKLTYTDSDGRKKADFCELENPVTAIEVGRTTLSNGLLRLLFITKLRTNLANLLSYLTAISAANQNDRLYVLLQILYNVIQYRQINLLPLLLLEQNLRTVPRKYHLRTMLELLQHVAPLNVRYAIKTLIQDFEKQAANYVGISENLIPLLTDTLDMDMIPGITAQLQRNVLFGNMDIFVNQVVDKAFTSIYPIRSVRELKDIVYLTMLNLPLSYSVAQLPIMLRLAAQLLMMELTDDIWICAAMRGQHIVSSTNVYIGLKKFLSLLLECPEVPATMQVIVLVTIKALPDATPRNDIYKLRITNFAPTAAEVIMGDRTIENRSIVRVTNSLGNIIVKRD